MKYIDSVIKDIPKVGIETYNNDNEIDYVIDTRELLEYLKPYEFEIPKEYNGVQEYLASIQNKEYIGGTNTSNYGGSIMHDLNIESYEINNKYYEVIMVHRGGDIRANYTDYFMLEFDYDTQFFEVVNEICCELRVVKEYKGKTYYIDLDIFDEYKHIYCIETDKEYDLYFYNDTSFHEEIDKLEEKEQ